MDKCKFKLADSRQSAVKFKICSLGLSGDKQIAAHLRITQNDYLAWGKVYMRYRLGFNQFH